MVYAKSSRTITLRDNNHDRASRASSSFNDTVSFHLAYTLVDDLLYSRVSLVGRHLSIGRVSAWSETFHPPSPTVPHPKSCDGSEKTVRYLFHTSIIWSLCSCKKCGACRDIFLEAASALDGCPWFLVTFDDCTARFFRVHCSDLRCRCDVSHHSVISIQTCLLDGLATWTITFLFTGDHVYRPSW